MAVVDSIIFLIVSGYLANLIKEYPEIGISVKYESNQYVINDLSKYSWAEKEISK